MAPLIYLFEDDASLRELLTELISEDLGGTVEPYATLASLRAACAARLPGLVIADFWGTSHLHLSETERSEIKALAALAPLVLVSARAWLLDAESNELGLLALIPKPLDMENFVGMLRQALEHAPGAPAAAPVDGEQAVSLPPRDTLSVFILGSP